ncbi:alpha-amylase/4-alpha-glucanotransferase domain-containing protein [Athalassotoga saccharophila]|uniref:alpha-amylase/4-alpha-glucanotransferase domain-containing protein n=1 Tax=Athalassotoga saccharophila TaxID=1441386 RepID=UPI00137AE8C3|nr:alpha-amylase/4-alpha-glucanotransferase domain-containing protein [Athalassotoga saccharophila]BBJ27964.1 alpha-amylase 1 [Athalassotoga saccharophila]
MNKVNFLFGIHNHQPVGNFGFVIEEAYERSYKPFIETLEKFPNVKMAIHFTGWLLDELAKRYPDYIKKVKGLVEKGQLEIFTGGFYEPIIPVIPEEDRVGQIKKLSERIEELFGTKPRGMWLAERVWEPQIAKSLALAGVEYVVVDDSHFKNAGHYEDELTGYYVTEEEGYTLKVFPISKKLRYLIPFENVEDTISFLKTFATSDGKNALVMFDDGEKFGVWPGTYDQVYTKKWLEEFFGAIEKNSSWLNSVSFSEYVDTHSAMGRTYLPISSYSEMMEWALPTRARANFESLIENLKKSNAYESMEMFLKGGIWRTFLAKYTESNLMHKKVLYIHDMIKKMNVKNAEILNEYWQGQCNDPYWHGVFGGLYLPHLRAAVYNHLIKAEMMIDSAKIGKVEVLDYDKDGLDEIVLKNDKIEVIVDPDYGGRVLEIDLRDKGYNLINSLTRRYEVYHELMPKAITNEQLEKLGKAKTIHDVILTKEEGLQRYLHTDWYERFSFMDHFFGDNATLDGYASSVYPEQGDFVNQPYEMIDKYTVLRHGHVWIGSDWIPVDVRKTFKIDGNLLRVYYTIKNASDRKISLWFGSEMTINLMSGESDDRYFDWGQKHRASYTGEFESKKVEVVSEYEKVHVEIETGQITKYWMYPIYTISYSEAGFEKVYQGTSLTPMWRFNLGKGEEQNFEITLKF